MIRTGVDSSSKSLRRAMRGLGTVLPAIWIVSVVAWEVCFPSDAQFLQLLAAAPAIACAGSGRRRCVVLGGCLAILALLPPSFLFPSLPGPAGTGGDLGTRLGTCCAVLAVVVAGYLTSGRSRRLARDLERSREVAAAAQRALLRPLPGRIEGLAVAAGHQSSTRGAELGGDLYEVLATPHGVRAVIGDVRGHGIAAVGTVAAVLGSFRDAAHEEARLADVLRRLERALDRHLRGRCGPEAARAAGGEEPGEDAFAEEFVTLLLLEVRADGELVAVNCGHPWPHRVTAVPARVPAPAVQLLSDDEPLPPLGLFPLPAALPVVECGRFLPGEWIVLHTDGADEARDARGRFFPLPVVLAEAVTGPGGPGNEPGAVAEQVARALVRHTGGRLTDDIALVLLRNDRGPAPDPVAAGEAGRTVV